MYVTEITLAKGIVINLLSLKSTHFGSNELSPFEIIIQFPMCLTTACFDPQLIKRYMILYCKYLMAEVENNHALVEQSFYYISSEDKEIKHHNL